MKSQTPSLLEIQPHPRFDAVLVVALLVPPRTSRTKSICLEHCLASNYLLATYRFRNMGSFVCCLNILLCIWCSALTRWLPGNPDGITGLSFLLWQATPWVWDVNINFVSCRLMCCILRSKLNSLSLLWQQLVRSWVKAF